MTGGMLIGFHIGRAAHLTPIQRAATTLIRVAQRGWPHRNATHTERFTWVSGPGRVSMQGATMHIPNGCYRNGVRWQYDVDLTPGHWRIYWCDAVRIGDGWLFNPAVADQVANDWSAMPYDLWGAVASAVLRFRQDPGKAFCSEFTAAQIGLPEPWGYHPARLESFVSRFGREVTAQVFDGTFQPPEKRT